MFKLMALIFFIALVGVMVYGTILENRIAYVDELIKRGADINRVVDKL